MKEIGTILFNSPKFWFITFCYMVILIIISLSINKIIGWFGELWTKKELKKLPKNEYKVINDVFILLNNTTHQIDHIVVSLYGIFCVETKQYNGYITGSKYDKKWVRHSRRKKYYYTNPIRQNYGHVKTLSELLNIDEKLIHNIVCIPSRAKLKIQHTGELTRNYNIVNKILSYNEIVLNNIDEIVDKINKNNITDKNIKKEHIKNIRKNIINDINTCPKCGEKLIERNGKYGIFLGCSNYPKCKYTRK